MNHQDAEISEIIVVIHANWCGRLTEAVNQLKAAGMEVESVDSDECVVNGEIDAAKVGELQRMEFVNVVRTVLTYIADYPVGDPRNKDLAEDDDVDAAEPV